MVNNAAGRRNIKRRYTACLALSISYYALIKLYYQTLMVDFNLNYNGAWNAPYNDLIHCFYQYFFYFLYAYFKHIDYLLGND